MPPAETVRPILKHAREEEGSPSILASKTAAPAAVAKVIGSSVDDKSDKSRHLTWDEHAIEEHDLLRGTRMKVSESVCTIFAIRIHKCVSGQLFQLTYLVFICKYYNLIDIQNLTTCKKIDEPDTPYTHYEHSDEESTSSGHHPRSPDENHPHHEKNSLANQWGDVSSKLQAVADKREEAGGASCPLSPALSRDSNMSDEEEKKQSGEHEKKFKDLRKKHYNEAEMMRKWREEHANMDEEEDEEEEDDDDAKMKE